MGGLLGNKWQHKIQISLFKLSFSAARICGVHESHSIYFYSHFSNEQKLKKSRYKSGNTSDDSLENDLQPGGGISVSVTAQKGKRK